MHFSVLLEKPKNVFMEDILSVNRQNNQSAAKNSFRCKKVCIKLWSMQLRFAEMALCVSGVCKSVASQIYIMSQNYKWQNGKECKGKTTYAQSALARRVRQNFLVDGSYSPLPSPPHNNNLAHPQTAPIGTGIGYRGGRWVRQRMWGGGEESSSISRLLRNSSLRQCYFEMKTM